MDNIEQCKKSFSERLRTLRNEQGLKQAYLAEKIGVSDTVMSRLENGSAMPKFDVLIHIADIFNVSIDYLVGRSDKKHFKRVDTENITKKGISYKSTPKRDIVEEEPFEWIAKPNIFNI